MLDKIWHIKGGGKTKFKIQLNEYSLISIKFSINKTIDSLFFDISLSF